MLGGALHWQLPTGAATAPGLRPRRTSNRGRFMPARAWGEGDPINLYVRYYHVD